MSETLSDPALTAVSYVTVTHNSFKRAAVQQHLHKEALEVVSASSCYLCRCHISKDSCPQTRTPVSGHRACRALGSTSNTNPPTRNKCTQVFSEPWLVSSSPAQPHAMEMVAAHHRNSKQNRQSFSITSSASLLVPGPQRLHAAPEDQPEPDAC